MGAGKLLGLALAGVISYEVIKKSNVGKDLKKLIRDMKIKKIK